MLVHPRFPGAAPQIEGSGRPVRTVIGDALKRFWRATKPPARIGAGAASIVLQRLVRAVLAVNMYLAAGAGIATLWTVRKVLDIVPLAVLALLMVVAKTVWKIILTPIQHVSLG